jgi:branched-chain amino acid aminotransferase
MNMQNFVNHNGTLIPSNQPLFTTDNRAFRYGDALFESIRITNSKPQFLKEHMMRLSSGIKLFKFKYGNNFNETFVEKEITKLAEKNNIITDGRVRMVLYRNNGRMYAPDDNSFSWIIEAFTIEDEGYVLNTKGLIVDLFTEYKKPPTTISNIKTANSLIYVLAGIYKNEHQLDECILLNDKHHIIEATSCNIFAVKNGVLYTPPVSDGCVDGVMRKKIIEIANANKIAVYEISVMQNVLLGADELFLTNAAIGIKWVVGYKQKRYFNNTSRRLIDALNEMVKNNNG